MAETVVCSFVLHAAAALLGGWAIGRYLGLDEVTSATYLVSSALCIAAIACLSQQSSARTGNALGLIGVSGGIVATLGGLNTDPGTYTQVIGSLAAGGLVGNQIASRINITDLPQMVAAYHSLVGLAAAITSIATIMLLADAGHEMDGVHMVTAFLGDIIGAITLTGSVSAELIGQGHSVDSGVPAPAVVLSQAVSVQSISTDAVASMLACCFRRLLPAFPAFPQLRHACCHPVFVVCACRLLRSASCKASLTASPSTCLARTSSTWACWLLC